VPESTIEQILVTAINQALCDKDSFLSILQENIETVILHENDQTLAGIDARLQELQMELVKLANSKAEYDKVGDEIYHLRDEKQKVQLESIGWDELKKRMADMSTFLKKQSAALTEYDEPLVRRLIEKVSVYEDKFTVEFKSGVAVDVDE
jgi:site-specific DNA recombinase